jgi:putative addiction module component (TIGR02574 family)
MVAREPRLEDVFRVGDDVPVTAAMKAELDRRLADHEANPDDMVSWAEVKAGLRQPR